MSIISDLFKSKSAPQVLHVVELRSDIETNRVAQTLLAADTFKQICAVLLPNPGDVFVPFNTSHKTPFTERVLTKEGRQARLAFALFYHPGIGPCVLCVPSSGAAWHSVREDVQQAMRGADGEFHLTGFGITYHLASDLNASTVLLFCDCVLRAHGQARSITFNFEPA